MNAKIALRQFKELKKYLRSRRLAADGWDEPWKTLISISLSAQTRDSVTISIATRLFETYPNLEDLASAREEDVQKIIRPINYHKTKTRNIIACARILLEKYHGKPPHSFEKLIELPGVGHKTANVFLATMGYPAIGTDTHVAFISQKLEWTNNSKPEKITSDLKKLFPKRYWSNINYVLVRFGQIYGSKKKKDAILQKISLIGTE